MIDFAQTHSWPPVGDDGPGGRLADYKRRRELYESEHAEAFARKSARLPEHLQEKTYLIQDYPKLITDVYADLIYGSPPVFSLPANQGQLDQLVRENRLFTRLYQGEITAGSLGDAVFKLSVGKKFEGAPLQVRIEEIQPHAYFVEVDPDNSNRVVSQCLAWERVIPGPHDTERTFLRVEHHEPGRIINELFEIVGKGKARPVPLSLIYGEMAPDEVEETGVDTPLLFHFPNRTSGGEYFGESDYSLGLESLFNEANARMTAIADVLDKHIQPKLIVPSGVLSQRGDVPVADLDIIEVWPEDAVTNAPRMLTWDAQLQAAFNQLQSLEEKIFQFSDVSPAMFGKDKAGNIESGRAMAMRFARMMTRTNRKRAFREPVLQDMLYTAMQLQVAWGIEGATEPVGLPEIIWRNGLPKDDHELSGVATAMVAARLMSRETAYRYFANVGADEARAEMGRVDADMPAAPPAMPSPAQDAPPAADLAQ